MHFLNQEFFISTKALYIIVAIGKKTRLAFDHDKKASKATKLTQEII